VRAVLIHAVGPELAEAFHIFAGDIVPRKKPAPDIYLLALHDMGLHAADVVVVEDSANGLRASHAAGLRTLVTVSSYTRDEDFSGASLVVSSLGEPDSAGGPAAEVISRAAGIAPLRSSFVDIPDLQGIIAAPLPAARNDSA
jgi:FMN phosphatase YigB (HAD superfamily)